VAVTFPRAGDGFTVLQDSTDPECAGLLPEGALPAAVSRAQALAAGSTCGPGLSEGTGHVALGQHDAANLWSWQDRDAAGTLSHTFWAPQLFPLLPEEQGFMGITPVPPPPGDPRPDTPLSVDLKVIAPDGTTSASVTVSPPRQFWSSHGYWAQNGNFKWELGEDPLGGAAVAFSYSEYESNPSTGVYVRRYAPDGTPRSAQVYAGAPVSLASGPEALAAAASSDGPTLVLWNFRADRSLAWYTPAGELLGQAFDDGRFAAALPSTGLADVMLQPLLDGSVALREDGRFTRLYRPGAITGEPAPAWLASAAPSAHLRFTRGNRGYALFPPASVAAAPCQQTVELRAPSGRLCGRVVASEGTAACTTGAIDQGWDGTLVQQSARGGCTHRFWPGLLASPGPRPAPPPLPGVAGDGFAVETLSSAGACAGLLPTGALPRLARASVSVAPEVVCVEGISEGTGHVALGRKETDPASGRTDFAWSARDAAGNLSHTFDADGLHPLVPQASGWHALAVEPGGVSHKVIRPDGTTARSTLVTPDTPLWAELGLDPRGGSVAAVSEIAGPDYRVQVTAFAPDGAIRFGPTTAVDEPGFGGWPALAAAARDGSVLVVWEVSGFQRWARWYSPTGAAGPAFLDGSVTPEAPPAKALVPLLDGTVALREAGQWTRVYRPGVTAGAAPPAWLAAHPGAGPRFTRGNRGYAFFPLPETAEAPTCDARVDLVAPDGTLCGRITFREAAQGCLAGAIDQGWDGTVVRQSAREACAGGSCTCSHQWWPRLLGP
jgi:hypothetical protein